MACYQGPELSSPLPMFPYHLMACETDECNRHRLSPLLLQQVYGSEQRSAHHGQALSSWCPILYSRAGPTEVYPHGSRKRLQRPAQRSVGGRGKEWATHLVMFPQWGRQGLPSPARGWGRQGVTHYLTPSKQLQGSNRHTPRVGGKGIFQAGVTDLTG